MATTFIDTNKIVPIPLDGNRGRCAEILSGTVGKAKNVVGRLLWLEAGQGIEAANNQSTHQVLYLMEGKASIRLDGKDYEAGEGAGIYLGPSESASIREAGGSTLKLLNLIVPSASR